MGHRSESGNSHDEKRDSLQEKVEHPFLQPNDMLYLSLTKPFLSPRGQKLVNFFLSMGDETHEFPALDVMNLVKGLSSKGNGEQPPLADLLPLLMNFLSNSDLTSKINPGLINSVLSAFTGSNNSKTEG